MPRVVPIYDEQSSFIGIWSVDENFQPSIGKLAELMGLAQPTLDVLTKLPTRRILISGLTRVGKNVSFECGVFVMVRDHKAPSEEYSGSDSRVYFSAQDYHGIPILKRVSDGFAKEASSAKKEEAKPEQSAPSAAKKWWEFWK